MRPIADDPDIGGIAKEMAEHGIDFPRPGFEAWPGL
jgi:hypothetical protein